METLLKIVSSGGGLILDSQELSTDALVRIAAASQVKGASIIIKNVDRKSTDALVCIAKAGQGNVIFDV